MENKSLVAAGVCKSYGKKEVLHNVDLTLEPGRIYGLIAVSYTHLRAHET